MLKKKHPTLLTVSGVGILLIFSLFYSQMEVSLSGLEANRFAVVQAVGEQGVFHINQTQFRMVDKIIRNGKFFRHTSGKQQQ